MADVGQRLSDQIRSRDWTGDVNQVITNGLALLKTLNAEAHRGIAEERRELQYVQFVFPSRTSVLPRRASAFKML